MNIGDKNRFKKAVAQLQQGQQAPVKPSSWAIPSEPGITQPCPPFGSFQP